MPWQTPSFREISMNSEIGGYQDELDERKPGDLVRTALALPSPPRDDDSIATG
ncbi:MAG TPA: hypothetical protein VIU63_03785 [Nitrospira sp.]